MLVVIRFIALMSIVFFAAVFAETSEEMKAKHKEIGDKLIAIRTKYPDAQQQIYEILDRVGKFHTQAQETSKALVMAEQKITNQEQAHKVAIDENLALKTKIIQARNEAEGINKKLLAYQADEKKATEKKIIEKQALQAKNSEEVEFASKNKLISDSLKKERTALQS